MQQFAAIAWKVKRGSEQDLSQLFADYQGPDSFTLIGPNGEKTGKLLATAVFIKDDTVVRVIEFDGELEQVLEHMAPQEGVRQLEDAVDPYLETPRDTSSNERFRAFFHDASMRCLVQRFADE